VLVVARWLLGGGALVFVLAEAALGPSAFVAAIVQIVGVAVAETFYGDEPIIIIIIIIVVVTFRFPVGRTLVVIVETALRSTVFVAMKVQLGGAIVGAGVVVVIGVVAHRLLPGAVLVVVETAPRPTEFVALVVESQRTVVGPIIVIPIVFVMIPIVVRFVVVIKPIVVKLIVVIILVVVPLVIVPVVIVIPLIVVEVVAHGALGRTALVLAQTALGNAVLVAIVIVSVGTIVGSVAVIVIVPVIIAHGLLGGTADVVLEAAFRLAVLVAIKVEFVRVAVLGTVVVITHGLLAVAPLVVVVATLGAAVFVAIVVRFVGAVAGISGIAIKGILVVAHALLFGTGPVPGKTALGLSVFVALVVEPKGTVVDDGFDGFAVLAFGPSVGALELVVVAALRATEFVAVVIGLGVTVSGISGISVGWVFEIARWLFPGAISFVVETAAGFSVFVTIVVESKGAVVDAEIIVVVVVVLLITGWLFPGALVIVVETAPGLSKLVTIVIESKRTVVDSVIVVVVFVIVIVPVVIVVVPIVIVIIVVVTHGLFQGALVAIIETTLGFALLVTVVIESKGTVVDGVIVIVVILVVIIVIVIIVLGVASELWQNHLIDEMDDAVASLDVDGGDFGQEFLPVALPDLVDGVVRAPGAGKVSAEHLESLAAVQVLGKVDAAGDVVLEDVGEDIDVIVDEPRSVGWELVKCGVGRRKDGEVGKGVVEGPGEACLLHELAEGAQAVGGTCEIGCKAERKKNEEKKSRKGG
jgi:hypothetical protein